MEGVDGLRESLCFHCDFDGGFDATFARGDGACRLEVDAYPPRLTTGGGGRFGEAAEFVYGEQRESIWTHDVLRYAATGNVPYRADEAWAGSIGMWLQVDIAALTERSLIWLDPFHLLGPDARSRGKIWMDFVVAELPGAPLMRYGATLPRPMRRNPEQNDEGHVITVPEIAFAGHEWHHVVGTWTGINGGPGAGGVSLYIDGERAGRLEGFEHRLAWDLPAWELRVGLGFAGRLDDLFVLDRALADDEVAALYAADRPFAELCGDAPNPGPAAL